MELIVYLIFGGLAGWIASMVMGTDEQQGILMNIIVGIVGAFIGGVLMNLLGQSGINGFNIYSMFVAIIGSVVLLWLYKVVRYR